MYMWVSLCVCVSQYSTNLDIHHLQFMAPLHASVCPVCLLLPKLLQPGHPHPPVHGDIICKCLSTCLSILSACPKTAPTWTSMSSSSLNLMSKRWLSLSYHLTNIIHQLSWRDFFDVKQTKQEYDILQTDNHHKLCICVCLVSEFALGSVY